MPIFLLILLILALPAPSPAEPGNLARHRVYFRVSGLAVQSQDSDLKFQPPAASPTAVPPKERVLNHEVDFNPGGGVSLAFGFTTDLWFRPEVEFNYRSFGLGNLITPGGELPASGRIQSLTFMFNIPFHWVNSTPFTPYLGGGLGLAWQRGKIDSLATQNVVQSTSGQTVQLAPVKDEGTELAYQVLAGVACSIHPRIDLVLGYRFTGTPDVVYQAVSLANRQHQLELGLRFFLEKKKTRKRKGRGRIRHRRGGRR